MSPADLKKWRKENNYSQSQLASVLGVATLTISKWERGVGDIPSFLHLALACTKKRDEKPLRGRPPRGKEVKSMTEYLVEFGNGMAVQSKDFGSQEKAERFADRIKGKYEYVRCFKPGENTAYLRYDK